MMDTPLFNPKSPGCTAIRNRILGTSLRNSSTNAARMEESKATRAPAGILGNRAAKRSLHFVLVLFLRPRAPKDRAPS